MALLVYPFALPNLDDPASVMASFTYVHFASYERMTTKSSTPANDIYLYLPEKMTMPSTVKWDMTGMGMAGKQAENALRGNKDGTVLDAIESGAKAAGSAIFHGGMKALGDGRISNFGNMYNAEHLSGLIAGGVPNPYLTMLFKGVDPRVFEFSFKFYPHDEAEALIIDKIVETFRADALPPGSQSYNPVHLGYPREYEIEYMLAGVTHPWLNRFKRSVITQISLDYTGAGMWSVSTQFQYPTYLVLNLTFTELEIVLRDDVYEGY